MGRSSPRMCRIRACACRPHGNGATRRRSLGCPTMARPSRRPSPATRSARRSAPARRLSSCRWRGSTRRSSTCGAASRGHRPGVRQLRAPARRPRCAARGGAFLALVRGFVARRTAGPRLGSSPRKTSSRGGSPPEPDWAGPGAGTLRGSHPARSEPMERLLLLDGNGLIYRGYFALIDQPLTTSKGELVTAVFGFTNIVLRAIQDAKPDRLAVAFDLAKPTFRHERYAEYKATRTRMPDDMREQIPKVREVVKALGIPVYERRGSRRTTRSPRSWARPRPRASRSSSSPATWTCSSSSRSGRTSWCRCAAASRTRSPTTSRRSRSAGASGPTRCSTTRRSRATRPTTSRASPGWGRRRRRSWSRRGARSTSCTRTSTR